MRRIYRICLWRHLKETLISYKEKRMRLLVVEGNKRETWQQREASGGKPYHKRFQVMLNILQPDASIEFAFPADSDTLLPINTELAAFDAVLWTGSSLSVNDSTPSVQQQLTFAEDVFSSGVPFYGSCWGLEIASVAAGGEVGPCSKGWEFGVSDAIELTEAGKIHSCFQRRKGSFSALEVHRDEVVKLPEDSIILAKNSHSKVQAITIRHRKSDFFGVQYHPEFTPADLASIARYLSKILIEEGAFRSEDDVNNFALKMESHGALPSSVADYGLHIQEVDLWLRNI